MRGQTQTEVKPQSTRLATKLYVPSVRPNFVPRPRLVDRLSEGAKSKLTLVSAPAGFGKTSLLAAWLKQTEMRAAWVSLDAEDNEPARFLDYLVGALQNIDKNLGATADELLKNSHPSPLKPALTGLINETAALTDEFVIVFDDYHLIHERSIHEAIAFFLDRLPAQSHLLIASRNDPPFPLARLRAKGELTEIRVADLRFDAGEAEVFLNELMQLNLTSEDVSKLGSRTEGWITGLQLSALSLQGRENKSDLINEFAGNDRFILDYLVEEVLETQPPNVQDFLLQTSVLNRLSSPLCDVLTENGDGQAMLEQLERANLFLFPLDNKAQWFRYHHLFADLLRFKLKQRRGTDFFELHRKASRWFAAGNLTEEAITHALAGEDWKYAISLIELIATEVMANSRFRTYGRWLEQIPEQALSNHPLLSVWNAVFLMHHCEIKSAEKYLQMAESATEQPQPKFIKTLIFSCRTFMAVGCGDFRKVEEFSQKAVDSIEPPVFGSGASPDVLVANVFAIHSRSFGLYLSGKLAEAEQSFLETIPIAREANTLILLSWAIIHAGLLKAAQGKLSEAVELVESALQYDNRQLPEQMLFAYTLLARLEYERNNLAASQKYLAKALAHKADLSGECFWLVIVDYLKNLAPVLWASGERTQALEVIDFEIKRMKRFGNLPGVRQAEALKAGLLLRRGDIETVERWAEESEIASLEPEFNNEDEQIVLARLLTAREKYGQALKLLSEELLPRAQAGGRRRTAFEIMLLETLILKHQGNEKEALASLEKLLAMTCPENYTRLFTDEGELVNSLLQTLLKERGKHWEDESPRLLNYVVALIKSFGETDASTPAAPPVQNEAEDLPWWYKNDPLSERELEVLGLVAQGLSNQQIGNKLFIAAGTVKRHVNNIYAKLDVHSRVQAVELARKFRLIPPSN